MDPVLEFGDQAPPRVEAHPLVRVDERVVYLNGQVLLTFLARADAKGCAKALIEALDEALGPRLMSRIRELAAGAD